MDISGTGTVYWFLITTVITTTIFNKEQNKVEYMLFKHMSYVEILNNINIKIRTTDILLVLSKAFDSIDHEILYSKLER